jgi:hypothetical protein
VRKRKSPEALIFWVRPGFSPFASLTLIEHTYVPELGLEEDLFGFVRSKIVVVNAVLSIDAADDSL